MSGAEEIWGVLGGGFGLYGYLPAVALRTTGRIHTLARYREKIRRRTDIQAYEGRIIFEQDAKAVFARCNAVIIALRPVDQEYLLAKILDQRWKGKIILEKPFARTPELALALLERLAVSGIQFRIGFTLGATAWATKLGQYLAANKEKAISLDFRWLFLAHHYRNEVETWKRYYLQGGGATRFYAIHLIALFSKWSFDSPVRYQRLTTERGEEPECRFAVSTGTWRASVVCDTKWQGKPGFNIRTTVEGAAPFEIALEDPFKETTPNVPGEQVDVRVGYLLKIFNSFDDIGNPGKLYYLEHVRLWSRLEGKAEPLDSIEPALSND